MNNAIPVSSALDEETARAEVYGLLVLDRGWSGERYERWMADTLTQQLLA